MKFFGERGSFFLNHTIWSKTVIRKVHNCRICKRQFSPYKKLEMYRPIDNSPFRMVRICCDCVANRQAAIENDTGLIWERR